MMTLSFAQPIQPWLALSVYKNHTFWTGISVFLLLTTIPATLSLIICLCKSKRWDLFWSPSVSAAHPSLSPTGYPPYPIPTPGLHQSCRHVVRSWANQSFGAHLHNMTLSNGKLRVPQDGRYYLYSQVTILYFWYYSIQKENLSPYCFFFHVDLVQTL